MMPADLPPGDPVGAPDLPRLCNQCQPVVELARHLEHVGAGDLERAAESKANSCPELLPAQRKDHAMSEIIYWWDTRDRVNVEREVRVWDVLDASGCEDAEAGQWRQRSPQEFAAAILRATEGLTDPRVEPCESNGSGVVLVYGYRPTTEAEKREFDTKARRQWEDARDVYAAGLAKWGQP